MSEHYRKFWKHVSILGVLLLVAFSLSLFLNYLIATFSLSFKTDILFISLVFLFRIFVLFKIIKFLLSDTGKVVKKRYNVWFLIITYAISTLILISLFSFLYESIANAKFGYLTYNGCSPAPFSAEEMDHNSWMSDDYFYFSAITYLTIGYGDICPRGAAQGISIMNGIMGHIFNSIVIGMAIVYFTSLWKVTLGPKKKAKNLSNHESSL